MLVLIFIACAFSAGVMVAGGLLPEGAFYWAIGGVVLVALALIFVAGLLGTVCLLNKRQVVHATNNEPLQGRQNCDVIEFPSGRYEVERREPVRLPMNERDLLPVQQHEGAIKWTK